MGQHKIRRLQTEAGQDAAGGNVGSEDIMRARRMKALNVNLRRGPAAE